MLKLLGTTSGTTKIQGYFDAMSELHQNLVEMDGQVQDAVQSKRRKSDTFVQNLLTHCQVLMWFPLSSSGSNLVVPEIVPMPETVVAEVPSEI